MGIWSNEGDKKEHRRQQTGEWGTDSGEARYEKKYSDFLTVSTSKLPFFGMGGSSLVNSTNLGLLFLIRGMGSLISLTSSVSDSAEIGLEILSSQSPRSSEPTARSKASNNSWVEVRGPMSSEFFATDSVAESRRSFDVFCSRSASFLRRVPALMLSIGTR